MERHGRQGARIDGRAELICAEARRAGFTSRDFMNALHRGALAIAQAGARIGGALILLAAVVIARTSRS